MIARKFFEYVCFALLVSVFQIVCCLEFKLPVCSESHAKAEYTLQDPVECKPHVPHLTKQCNISIFKQEHFVYNIPAISCQQVATITTATFYFFGAKTHSFSSDYSTIPSLLECLLWNSTLIAPNVGKFSQSSKNVFKTRNNPYFDYRWPTTTHHTTLNAILTRFTLLYNPFNKKLSSPFQQLDHCKVHKGFCKLSQNILVWNPPAKLDCPQLRQIENTTMTLHISSKQEIYRLEVPKFGISIHHWYTCPAKSECLKSDAICGFSQFVILPYNCQLKKQPLVRRAKPRQHSSKLYAAYLQDLEDNLIDSIKRLEASHNYLQCKIQNLLTLTLTIQSKLYPSQILSALLGTKRAAVVRGDTMSELSCSPLKVRLKRSLIHGNFYATRPLFEPVQTDHLTNSFPRVFQLNQDFYLSDTVSFLESYRPNRVFRFKIDKSFYLFINYTLAGIAQDTIKLSPTLFPINETITSRDYIADSSLIDYEPIVDRNLNALLATLATTSLRTERIQAFLDSQSNYSSVSSADIHFFDVTHLLHNSFFFCSQAFLALFSTLFYHFLLF